MNHVIQCLPSWRQGYAESTPGQRTAFSFCLPLHATAPDDELSPTVTFNPEHGHVLFVDDDELLVDLEKEVLEILGYKVTGCAGRMTLVAQLSQ